MQIVIDSSELEQLANSDNKDFHYLKPYYDFMAIIKEIENYEIEVHNKENMSIFITLLEDAQEQFYIFFINNKLYYNSSYCCSKLESVHNLFADCINHIKSNEGRNYEETESSIKLAKRFLLLFAGFFDDNFNFSN